MLLDDRQARSVTGRLDVPMLGVVGVLLKAKEAGLLPAVRPEPEALDANGFHLAASLRAAVLRLADE